MCCTYSSYALDSFIVVFPFIPLYSSLFVTFLFLCVYISLFTSRLCAASCVINDDGDDDDDILTFMTVAK